MNKNEEKEWVFKYFNLLIFFIKKNSFSKFNYPNYEIINDNGGSGIEKIKRHQK